VTHCYLCKGADMENVTRIHDLFGMNHHQ
jgi:hypothetical protein